MHPCTGLGLYHGIREMLNDKGMLELVGMKETPGLSGGRERVCFSRARQRGYTAVRFIHQHCGKQVAVVERDGKLQGFQNGSDPLAVHTLKLRTDTAQCFNNNVMNTTSIRDNLACIVTVPCDVFFLVGI